MKQTGKNISLYSHDACCLESFKSIKRGHYMDEWDSEGYAQLNLAGALT